MMTTTTAATTATAATATATTALVAAITVQQAVALGAIATAFLIGLLILKELLVAYSAETHVAGTFKGRVARFYAANLNVAIVPMMLIFGLLVVTKVATAL